MGVLMQAQEMKNQSELEQSLSKDIQDLQEKEESTHSWLKEQHLNIELLGEETQLQERMNGAQVRDKEWYSTFTKYVLKENSLTYSLFILGHPELRIRGGLQDSQPEEESRGFVFSRRPGGEKKTGNPAEPEINWRTMEEGPGKCSRIKEPGWAPRFSCKGASECLYPGGEHLDLGEEPERLPGLTGEKYSWYTGADWGKTKQSTSK